MGPAGLVALLQLWTWAAQNKPDGNLSGMDNEDVAIASGWDNDAGKLVSALSGAKFLDGQEGGYVLHGWQEHQAYAAAEPARIERARKAAQARWAKRDASGNTPSMLEHASSNAQFMQSHDLAMPQTKPNQTKPNLEEHTHDGSHDLYAPADSQGVRVPSAPLNGEDVEERKDAAQVQHRRGDYEFSLVREAYDKARLEGQLSGRQEFLTLYNSQAYPGHEELIASINLLCEQDDQFQRGFAPSLAKFLTQRMWTMKPRPAAGQEREPEMTPERLAARERIRRMEEELKQKEAARAKAKGW